MSVLTGAGLERAARGAVDRRRRCANTCGTCPRSRTSATSSCWTCARDALRRARRGRASTRPKSSSSPISRSTDAARRSHRAPDGDDLLAHHICERSVSESRSRQMPTRSWNWQFYDVIVIGAGHAGVEAAWAAARHGPIGGHLHALDGHRRAHALQSRGWRHGEGSSRSRDRCARRPDGPGDRRDGNPVQAAQSQPGPGGLVAARPGGQAASTASGLRAALGRQPGISWIFGKAGRDPDRRRPGRRARAGRRRALPRARRWSSRPARSSTGWSTSARSSVRQDAPESRRRSALAESLKSLRFPLGPAEDGNAAAPVARKHRLLALRRGARRRSARAVLLLHRRHRPGADRAATCCTRPTRVHELVRAHIVAVAAVQRADSRASVRGIARRSKTR